MSIQPYFKSFVKIACLTAFLATAGCNTKTGDNSGEENRENPNMEKGDETNTVPPTERHNNERANTNGGLQRDSINLDSASIKQ